MKIILITIVLLLLSLNVSPSTMTKSEKFLIKYEKIAINLMNKYDIPASIILGISMLESGHGTSNMSKTKNNFFGIKGKKDGIWYYKKYENDFESFEDFCKIIAKKNYYSKLTKNGITDYNIWIEYINNGGYAESEYWNKKVLSCINQFNLHEIDNNQNYVNKLNKLDTVVCYLAY